MHRVAVFVDAGYLYAQGAVSVTGTQQRREFLSLDIGAVEAAIHKVVSDQSGLPLLRIYWYDAIRHGRPTAEQQALADHGNIKVRLGQVNAVGEQKGVDALIITDLAELARNKAMADAVLISGDEDLRVGVMLAQQFGVRVHLVGIKPATGNQSHTLRQEADTTVEWDETIVRSFLTYSPPVTPPSAVPLSTAALEAQIQSYVTGLAPDVVSTLKTDFEVSSSIPSEHDRVLMRIGRVHYGQTTLLPAERTTLRTCFVSLVKASS